MSLRCRSSEAASQERGRYRPQSGSRMFWIAGLLLILSTALSNAGHAADSVGPAGVGGHASLTCAGCHTNSAALGATTEAPTVDNPAVACRRCHTQSFEASHPVGFTPSRSLPEQFPLRADGSMTCSTCHELHGEAGPRLRGGLDAQTLCQACHDEKFFASMSDGGSSLRGRAHLDAGQALWHDLDPYSRRCLMCHDSKTDGADPAGTGWSNVGWTNASNHPIGVSYQDAERFGGYRPRLFLSKEILLPRGIVSCTSCHLPYSREHGRLANSRGSICLECHAL